MDADAGAKTLHTCARLCALVHSLLAQPGVPLGFFPALSFSGTGEGRQDHCSRGWLSAPAAIGKFHLDSKKLEDPAIPALPFLGSALDGSLHAFPQLKSGVKLEKKRTWLFIFYPFSCIMLHIVLRYLLLGGCLLSVCTFCATKGFINTDSLCFVWPLEKRGSLYFINEKAKMC